jgi:hypothetical protein
LRIEKHFHESLYALLFFAGISLNADEPRPPPTLAWEPVEYAYCYEITLETYDEESASYVPALTVQTEDTSLALPLPEGLYRYKIAVFNVLDKIDISSDWEPLVIRKAYQPQITLINPEKIYLDETPAPSLSFKVKNFIESSEVFLVDVEGTGENLAPGDIEIDGEKITFTPDFPAPGIYEARLTNPGGLTASSEKITVYQYKPWNIDIAFSPPFVTTFRSLSGGNVVGTGDAPVLTIASKMRFSFFLFKANEMNFFGIEILPLWFFTLSNGESELRIADTLGLYGTLAYHRYFSRKKFALIARLGAGFLYAMPFVHDTNSGENRRPANSLFPSAALGATLEFFPFGDNKIFFEAGIDFFVGLDSTIIGASLGVGRRF